MRPWLRLGLAGGESERTSLRISADRPAGARMYHLTTELTHLPQRRFEVVHFEVGQGVRVAGSFAPLVHAERRGAVRRLPALALITRSLYELNAQDSGPEAPGAMRIIGRELNEMYRRAHPHHDTLPAM